MLDLSDKHQAPAGHRAVARPSPAPAEAAADLPKVGQHYRHFQGALYTVEGLCHQDGDLAPAVLYRALDPLAPRHLLVLPVAEFSGPQSKQVSAPRFSPLHTPTDGALHEALPAGLVPTHVLSHVLAAHESPLRHFHTREHVLGMFERAKRHGMHLSPEQVIALLFQDVAYLAGAPAGLNEQLSVSVLQDLSPQMGAFDLELASRIIADTAENTATIPESQDIVELNMAYLADHPIQFCAADERVWLENRHLLDRAAPRRDYDTRRLKFLLGLAKRGPLFPAVLKALEEPARNNLEGLRQAWVRKYPQDKKAA